MRISNERRKYKSTLSRLARLSAIAMLLGACFGTNTNGTGEPSATDEFALTIVARTDSGAPDDFGIVPGDVVVGAKVSVANIEIPEKEAASGITDDSGKLVVMVSSGKYNVYVKGDTHDPYCYWYGSTEVEVKNKGTTVSVDDLWVVCQ